MSQCERILEVLADGHPHGMREIHQRAGFCRLNSRVAEFRKRGHNIPPAVRTPDGDYLYQLGPSLGETDPPADDGGDPSGPTVAASHVPQSTNPTAGPVSPNEDEEQLSLLDSPRRGAYSEAA